MSPRIRPSSTFRSTLSTAIVAPNVLRRPRASMHAMRLTLLRGVGGEQVLRRQAEGLDGGIDCRPLVLEDSLGLRLEPVFPCDAVADHAEPPPLLDHLFVDELLI